MSTYIRKTKDEYNIQQQTEEGWETVNCELTIADARRSVREYRKNQPEYPVKIKKTRVKIKR